MQVGDVHSHTWPYLATHCLIALHSHCPGSARLDHQVNLAGVRLVAFAALLNPEQLPDPKRKKTINASSTRKIHIKTGKEIPRYNKVYNTI